MLFSFSFLIITGILAFVFLIIAFCSWGYCWANEIQLFSIRRLIDENYCQAYIIAKIANKVFFWLFICMSILFAISLIKQFAF